MPEARTQSIAGRAGFDRLASLIVARMGLHFPENRHGDLWRGAEALAREHGYKEVEPFLESLLATPLTERQVEVLTAHLTVGETYFFREMKSLVAFRDHLVPALVRRQAGGEKRIRVWSAGCSSGEEAYTLAMLLADAVPHSEAWNIEILATDINAASLAKARRGIYTKWSFRGVPDAWRERYFDPAGAGTFAVKPKYKAMVNFTMLNLAADAYPSLQNDTNAMDVIFCRNVMLYFVPEVIRRVVQSFHHCLVDGGWFIVAPSECTLLQGSEFSAVPFDGAVLYQKGGVRPPALAIRPPPPVVKHIPESWTASRLTVASQPVSPAVPPKPLAPPPPGRMEKPYEKALAAYLAGQYAEAAAILQACLDDGHSLAGKGESLALMARIEANQGRLPQAVEWAGKAIATDKVNPGFYYLLGTILEEQRQGKDAVQAFQRALYLDPDSILAHYALGNFALHESRFQEAKRHFRNARMLLARRGQDEVLPEADGVTAGRLLEIIDSMLDEKGSAP